MVTPPACTPPCLSIDRLARALIVPKVLRALRPLSPERKMLNCVPLLVAVLEAETALFRSQTALRSFVDSGKTADRKQFGFLVAETMAEIDRITGAEEQLSQKQKELIDMLRDELKAYRMLADQAIAARMSEQWNVARYRLANEALPLAREVTQLLTDMSRNQDALMKSDAWRVKTLSNLASGLAIALIFATTVAAWLISTRAASRLSQPIESLMRATKQLAKGQLDRDIPVTSSDELGHLTESFNAMRASLIKSETALEQRALEAQLLHRDKRQQWIYYRVNTDMTRDLVRLLTACC